MFCDPLQESLERQGGAFTRTSDLDLFSNLPDLMQCSSQLIRSMAPYLDHPPSAKTSASTPSTPSTSHQELPGGISSSSSSSSSNSNNGSFRSTKLSAIDGGSHPPYRHRRHLSQYEGHTSGLHSPSSSFSLASPSPSVSNSTASSSSSSRNTAGSNRLPFHLNADARMLPSPNDQLLLGKELCTMANQFVVYLRCALDYKVNRKKLDHRAQHNKGFAMYQEKLASRKETNQFYVHDFLIIPIQRIARYGLLLADLQKHTEKNHPDYYHISRARMVLTALAVAMNKAQQ
ncbi:Dbl homology domain-containing protein, partial [Absidia repens]